MEVLISRAPQVLLEGFALEQEQEWRAAFTDFWRLYREYDANHPVFQEQHDMSVRLPVFCHGDEGRGLRRVPFMVEAWQPVLSHKGANCTNMSGYPWQQIQSTQ